MFLWPLFLCGALVAIGALIALEPRRELLARAHVVAFLAHERCAGCGRPYGRLTVEALECVLIRCKRRFFRGARPEVFCARCPGCGAPRHVALRRGDAHWFDC